MMVLGSLDKFLLGRASTEYVEDVNDEPDDLAFVLTVVKNPAAVADVELFARLVAVMSVTLSDKRNVIVMRGTIVASVVEIARSCVKLKLAASVCIDCAKCIFRIASATSENRLHMIDTMPYLAAFFAELLNWPSRGRLRMHPAALHVVDCVRGACDVEWCRRAGCPALHRQANRPCEGARRAADRHA